MIFSLSKLFGIAVAAIALFTIAPATEARADALLPPIFTAPDSSDRTRDFPGVVEPWVPVRRVRRGHCADQGGLVICRFSLLTVPPERVLRIDNVSCGGPVEATNVIRFFILSTSADFMTLHPVAVIPAKQSIELGSEGFLIVANEPGPYFFKPGETVYILGGGTLDNSSNCMISGGIARTN